MEATPRPWLFGMPILPALRTWWRNASDEDEIVLIYQQVTTLLNAYTSLTASHDRLVAALENALNGIDAALVDVRATRRRGSLDPGLEAAEYNLTHLMNDVDAARALARGEVMA